MSESARAAIKEHDACGCAPYPLRKDAYPRCGHGDCGGPADILLEDGDDNGLVLCVYHYILHARVCEFPRASTPARALYEQMTEEAEGAAKATKAAPKPVATGPCAACGNELTDGRCRFINHKQAAGR